MQISTRLIKLYKHVAVKYYVATLNRIHSTLNIKTMKKIILTMVAAAMIATNAMAQEQQGQRPERKMDKTEMAKMRTERMVKELGLDATQQERLLALNMEFSEKMPMRGPRSNRPAGPRPEKKVDATTGATAQQQPKMEQRERPSKEQMEARHKEMEANREAYNGELKKILTPEQFAKYEEAQKNRMRRENHHDRHHEHGHN